MAHDFQADIDAVGRIDAVPLILDLVCRTTGMGFAAVARVTEDRWVACHVLDAIAFGIEPGSELAVETTICHEIRQSHEPVVINHVSQDPVFAAHPTPRLYDFQSYISVPIMRRGGEFFGTLCAIDPHPAKLENPQTIGMFKLFADLIAAQLDADEELQTSAGELANERQTAQLREQFIAVLGHDLRNPVASIDAGTRLLLRAGLDAKSHEIVELIAGSTRRMAALIDDLMDFARGRLGGGFAVDLSPRAPLGPALEQVVAEVRAANPERRIEVSLDIIGRATCDSSRLAQLLSNLLANAVAHGLPDTPIIVEGSDRSGTFELSVTNFGGPIPAPMMARLFEPFVRADNRSGRQGLGLGLYIASEIAKAHGGELSVTSNETQTCFSFRGCGPDAGAAPIA